MKLSSAVSMMTASLWVVATAQAVPQPMRDAATSAELAAKYRKSSAENPLKTTQQEPLTGEDPTKVNQPKNLMETSDFISFQGIGTLIPKGSIIMVPKNYKDRIRLVPGTRLMTWAEFFPLNRGWIKTLEVTRAQAQGDEPLDEKVAELVQKSSIVVVATYKGGPISMLPPKAPAEEGQNDTKR